MLKKLLCLTGTIVVLLAFLCGPAAFAQNKTVRGKIVDAQGAPVVGAAIVLVGNASVGAVTDADGTYSLNVPAGASLEYSCIGYATQVIPVADKTVIDVILREDAEFLEETVVIGYGVQRKSDLTGSVASVRSEELMDRSTSDAAAALQGKAAGVQVYTNSGAPGEKAHIRVRGISSNSGSGLGPLFIVDGLKVDDIQYLDPSMIESMEVLKDAASAAIYGAQAGNGVILVTTKGGAGSKSRDGQIFYNYKFTQTSLGHRAEVLHAEEFIDFQTQAGQRTRESLINSGIWDGKTDTNWAEVLYGKGVTQSHTFGAQGSNDRGSYFVSLNYVDENGMANTDKDYYKRLTAQVNADYKIKSWFTVGTNTSIERYQKADIGSPQEYGGTLLGALIIDPLTPVYFNSPDEMPFNMNKAYNEGYEDQNGVHHNYNFYQNDKGQWYSTSGLLEGDGMNPLINIARAYGKDEGWRIRGTVFGNLSPIKGLVFTSRLGYRISQSYNSNFSEPYYVNSKHHSETYSISASSSQSYYYQWENFANYNRDFGKHAVGVMAGMSYTFSDSRGVNASLEGEDPLKGYDDNFRYLSQDNGSGKKGIGGGQPSNSTQISYFGRLTYSYDNRYSLQANFRADAFDSSKLSAKNRWGYFPSVSAGWTVSNERFIKENISRDFLSFLKLRASWGINGNIAVLSGYPYSTSISYNDKNYQYHVGDNTLDYGSVPDGLANPGLTWETSVQTDLGLDMRLFNNRLTFGFDWFNKNTEGLIVSIAPLAEIGISASTPVNAGSVNNRGLEFELGWQDNIGDFHYSLNGNFSTLKNKVTYLDPLAGEGVKSGSHFANYKLYTWFEEGYPLWYLNGYKYAGIGSDGYAEFYDKDGNITANPTTDDRQFLGSTIPSYSFGLTLRMDWKGVDLTVFGTGSGGNYLVPCIYRTEHIQINTLRYFYDEAGKSIPAIDKIYDKIDFWSSSATMFKGDFFKIKQIQLGYTLPRKWTNKVFIRDFRAFVSMDDWFVFTKYPGFDPEAATTGSSTGRGLDKGTYPNAKKLMFGVNLSF